MANEASNEEQKCAASKDVERERTGPWWKEAPAFSQALIGAIPGLLFEVDRQGRYFQVWANSPELLAAQKEALLGKTVHEVLSSEGVASVMACLRETEEKGDSSGQTIRIDLPDGARWFELSASKIPGHPADDPHFLVALRDVTKYKRMEAELKASEFRYRHSSNLLASILESASSLSVYALDREYRYLSFNKRHRQGAKLLWDADICIGMNMLESIPDPAYREFCRQGFDRVLAGHDFFVESKAKVVEDGVTRYEYHENYGSPIFDDHGQVTGLTVFAINISERKEIQQRLELLERAVDQSSETVFLIDSNAKFNYVNDTACRVLGYTREELLTMTPLDIDSQVTPEALNGLVQSTLSGKSAIFESCHRTKDGRIFPVELSATPVDFGEQRFSLTVGRDISERKRIEAEKQQLLDILDKTVDFVGSARMDGSLLYHNRAARRMVGLPEDADLSGMTVADMHPAWGAKRVKEIAIPALCESGVWRGENALLHRDGHEIPVDQLLMLHRDADGKPLYHSTIMTDITERKRIEAELALRELEFRSLAENVPDNIARFDRQSRYLYINPTHERTLGACAQEFIGKEIPASHTQVRAAVAQVIASGEPILSVGQAVPDENGELRLHDVSLVPERNGEGEIVSVLGIGRDVTDVYRMQEALRAREREFRTLVENSPDIVVRYGRDFRRLYVNPAYAASVEGGAERLIGKTPSEFPGGAYSLVEEKLAEVFARGVQVEFEFTCWHTHGREQCTLLNLTPEFDNEGHVESVLAVGRDITELHEYRQKIHDMAFYDQLTSLPNRVLFNEQLRQTTESTQHGKSLGVMIIDMDCFKAVNDTFGHALGDRLLRETAMRLKASVRPFDTVARLGGDEFAILLTDVGSRAELVEIANKLHGAFVERFVLEGKEVFASCSIGVALFPEDSTDPDDLMKYADSAMYLAKRSGRNDFRFYSKELTVNAKDRFILETELRQAMERNELELYYQPKIALSDGSVIGSEALLRWSHPQLGMVPPDRFIPIAEETGIIVEMGAWILREACRTAAEWNGPDRPLHRVAINLSARQFQSNDLIKSVSEILLTTGCRAQWIELEITESLLLEEHDDVLDVLTAFRNMGITIAIDDFGTGYSALSYLARFPIDTLKIDRSFIQSFCTDHKRAELVKAILYMAHCLGQQVVAEGVETMEHATFLRENGCEFAQGFLYSKPLRKIDIAALPRHFSVGVAMARKEA